MMKVTANLGLKKPEGTDVVDIGDFNVNADILDVEVVKKASATMDGRMSKEDKVKLDGATSAVTASALMSRDTNGRAKVAAPSASDDIARKDTVDAVQTNLTAHVADYIRQPGYGIAGGSANAYTLTLSPAPTSYSDGMGLVVRINASNTGDSRINVNGLGNVVIIDSRGTNLTSGRLLEGVTYSLRYSASEGCFVLQGDMKLNTPTAMASSLILRDDSGRAKVAAPSASDDIARKDTVDAVQSNLTSHTALTSTAHGATSAATASTLMSRDANGRAKVATPSASDDIATKGYVDSGQVTAGTGLSKTGNSISVANGGITSTMLATGAVAANLGFNPMNAQRVYGNNIFTDSIPASSSVTKLIALGGNYSYGQMVIGYSSYAAFVTFDTNNLHALASGFYSSTFSGGPYGTAWSRRSAGYIGLGTPSGNNDDGFGFLLSGDKSIQVNDIYISGSNLAIVFQNRSTSSAKSLNCTIDWQVW